MAPTPALKRKIICFLSLNLFFFSGSCSAEEKNPSDGTIIVNATSLNIRQGPSTSEPLVYSANFAEVLLTIEKTEQSETIGGNTAHWYNVENRQGRTGYAFGSFLHESHSDRIFSDTEKLLEERLKNEPEYSDLLAIMHSFDSLRKIQSAATTGTYKGDEVPAEEFYFLMFLKTAEQLSLLLPFPYDHEDDRANPERDLTRYDDLFFYDEISAMHLLSPVRIWERVEATENQRMKDEFAYFASNMQFGGECEGFHSCYIGLISARELRYLQTMPEGSYRNEVENDMIQFLDRAFEQDVYDFDREYTIEALEALLKDLENTATPALEEKVEKILEDLR